MEFKRSHDVDHYVKCFNEQVLDRLNAKDVVKELDNLLLGMTTSIDYKADTIKVPEIALICYEKPPNFCHRHLVAEWLRRNGFECEEWDG